jgi:hypothetical protein
VVDHEEKNGMLWPEHEESCPEWRPSTEVEGLRSGGLDSRTNLILFDRDDAKVHWHHMGLKETLMGHAVVVGQHSPQHFVALDHIGQGAAKCHHVQWSRQLQYRRQVVCGVGIPQSIEDPQPALCKGQRKHSLVPLLAMRME